MGIPANLIKNLFVQIAEKNLKSKALITNSLIAKSGMRRINYIK